MPAVNYDFLSHIERARHPNFAYIYKFNFHNQDITTKLRRGKRASVFPSISPAPCYMALYVIYAAKTKKTKTNRITNIARDFPINVSCFEIGVPK